MKEEENGAEEAPRKGTLCVRHVIVNVQKYLSGSTDFDI
jgi:hypothetical protein